MEQIVYHDYCDVSVAVATPNGLVVPVIRDCHTMSFADVEHAIVSLGCYWLCWSLIGSEYSQGKKHGTDS